MGLSLLWAGCLRKFSVQVFLGEYVGNMLRQPEVLSAIHYMLQILCLPFMYLITSINESHFAYILFIWRVTCKQIPNVEL